MAAACTIHRTLNITKDPSQIQLESILLRRCERGLTDITGHFILDGKPFDATGYTVKFRALNADREWIVTDVKVSKDTVTYTVDSDLTAAEGDVTLAYFELSKDGGILTTESLAIYVLEDADMSAQEAERRKNQIDALTEELNKQSELFNEAEQKRVTAENGRVAAENTRKTQESAREAAESERGKEFTAAQTERANAFTAAEATRDATVAAAAKKATDAATKADTATANADAAEAKRADAEAKRVTAEQGRVTAESGRVTAESARAAAEKERESAQDANDLAQTKNNADQAANNQMAKGFLFETAQAGSDGKPNVSSPKMGVLYMIPKSEGKDPDQHQEWLWTGTSWELWGDTNATVTPITTTEIDSAFGGTALTTDHVLVAPQLTYAFTLIKNFIANTAKAASAKLADVATKLGNATVGSATEPIYLNQGVPTKITKVGAASTADSATKATSADSATTATTATKLAATLGVAGGGTGATTLTANQVLLGNGTTAIKSTAASGTGVLQRSTATAAPTFGTVPTGMIADNAITTGKIANGTIEAGDLNAALLKRITDLEAARDSLTPVITNLRTRSNGTAIVVMTQYGRLITIQIDLKAIDAITIPANTYTSVAKLPESVYSRMSESIGYYGAVVVISNSGFHFAPLNINVASGDITVRPSEAANTVVGEYLFVI